MSMCSVIARRASEREKQRCITKNRWPNLLSCLAAGISQSNRRICSSVYADGVAGVTRIKMRIKTASGHPCFKFSPKKNCPRLYATCDPDEEPVLVSTLDRVRRITFRGVRALFPEFDAARYRRRPIHRKSEPAKF